MTEHLAPPSQPTSYLCPACGATASLHGGCPGCGLPPDQLAAEVTGLDYQLAELSTREQQWRAAHAAVLTQLHEVRARRDALAAQMMAAIRSPRPTATASPAPVSGPPPTSQAASPARVPQTSSRTVQALLFVLGGLLLGTGAIVFTAVAWTRYGVGGRAVILAAVTALMLAAPVSARRRQLGGTAETFAALAILLVLLDGYAVWSVDLLGVRAFAGSSWAALVCAVAAAVAIGYARLGMLGPRVIALLVAQPVLPLLAAGAQLGQLGWVYLLVTLAGLNLALRWWLSGASKPVRVFAWVIIGGLLAMAGMVGTTALLNAPSTGSAAIAGGAVLVTVALLGGVGHVSGARGWWTVTVALAVPAVALVLGRTAGGQWPAYGWLVVAAAVAVAVIPVALAVPALPERWRPRLRTGILIGGLITTGAVAQIAVMTALIGATVSIEQVWSSHGVIAGGSTAVGTYDWQLLAALLLLAVTLVALVPNAWREAVVLLAALAAVAVPVALPLVWWTPLALGLPLAAVLTLVAARAATWRVGLLCGAVGVGLWGFTLAVGIVTIATMALCFGAVVLYGGAAAVQAARHRSSDVRSMIGTVSLVAAMAAWPVTAAAGVAALGVEGGWPARAALAAGVSLLLPALLARRAGADYLAAAVGALHILTPLSVIGGIADPAPWWGLYAGVALLALVAAGWLRPAANPGWWLAARAPVAMVALGTVTAPIMLVLVGPYEWFSHVWQQSPAGTGVTVTQAWPDNVTTPLTLLLLAGASGLAGLLAKQLASSRAGQVMVTRWAYCLVVVLVPTALLVGLVQLGAPWPTLPVASLLLGTLLVLATVVRIDGVIAGVASGFGALLLGAGIAGAMPARWSTLAALALVVALATVVGVAGRRELVRVAGIAVAAGSLVVLAVTATRAADLTTATGALVVLTTAAVLLAVSLLPRNSGQQRAVLEGGAHLAALVALLLSLPIWDRMALVTALWGVAIGLRAMWPGQSRAARVARAGVAGGCQILAWWMLVAAWQVTSIEAYTLPAAAAGTVAGILVLRARPQLGSAVALGPGLAAGFLPSLFMILVDPSPWRRLLLGAAAVIVVLVGAMRQWRAPVLLGALAAALVALHELALVWQQLDAWIPLTAAGLVVVGLAATYERRRRDVVRLRGTLARMR